MGGLAGVRGWSCQDTNLQRTGLAQEDKGTAQETQEQMGVDVPVQEYQDDRRVDRVQWSWNQEKAAPEETALEFIERMKRYFPDIVFHMPGSGEDMDLSGTAAEFGKGMHIVITDEFLARMQGSREEFDKCAKILTGEAAKLMKRAGTGDGLGVFLKKDKVVAWTALSKDHESVLPVIESVKQDDPAAVKTQFKVSCSVSASVSGHYKKMASARSRDQVQQVMSDIQRNMMNLKIAAICGDDEQRVKASRAVRSLQKLLSRGSRKIGRLNREKLKQAAYKKAERQSEEKKRRNLELELKKMRSARKGADYSMLQEGASDEAYIRSYRRYRGLYDAVIQPAPAGDMALMSGTVDAAGMGGGGVSPADISFSGEYSF